MLQIVPAAIAVIVTFVGVSLAVLLLALLLTCQNVVTVASYDNCYNRCSAEGQKLMDDVVVLLTKCCRHTLLPYKLTIG
jgi:hypothetical protein